MYMVFKNARPAGTKKFASYEEARQYARKLCRRKDPWYTEYSTNPSIGLLGYSVKRVG